MASIYNTSLGYMYGSNRQSRYEYAPLDTIATAMMDGTFELLVELDRLDREEDEREAAAAQAAADEREAARKVSYEAAAQAARKASRSSVKKAAREAAEDLPDAYERRLIDIADKFDRAYRPRPRKHRQRAPVTVE